MEKKTVAEVLRELREERGWSKNQLAKIVGVSKTAVTMWESGTRKPNRTMSEKLCELYSVDYNYLHGTSEIRNSYGEAKDLVQIPIYKLNDYPAGKNIPANEYGRLMLPAYSLKRSTSYFAIQIEDNSMKNYELYIGDIAIFEMVVDVTLRGKTIVCASYNGQNVIRMCDADENMDYTLKSGNPEYPDVMMEKQPKINGILAATFHYRMF